MCQQLDDLKYKKSGHTQEEILILSLFTAFSPDNHIF